MTNQEKIVEFLKNSGMYYLATVDREGQPHVRIFTSRVVVDDKVYIQADHRKSEGGDLRVLQGRMDARDR